MPSETTVDRYLEALDAQDWAALPDLLAEDVYRMGPYRDVVEGREAYATFLEGAITPLERYRLIVERIDAVPDPAAPGPRFWVRLSENFDVGEDRMRAEEALEFHLDAEGRIAYVAVFLQQTERSGPAGEG